tara:strand:+ start:1815 stop:3431 length:1617 start_codon:yes stop_codon:yes gene_type:complete
MIFSFKNHSQSNGFEVLKNLELIDEIFENLELYFVDDPQTGKIAKTGIDAMLNELDPYTVFYHESSIEDYRMMTTGQYGGIGSLIRTVGDYTIIAEPYENSPSQKSGLKAGDKILFIDGNDMKLKKVSDVSSALKGAKGSEVKITIMRDGVGQKVISLTRAEIKIPDVPYSGVISDSLGYIKLNSFTNSAHEEVKKSFLDLKQKGINKLIFDLRGNGGGLLLESIKIVNLFVPENKLVVRTKGRIASENKDFKTWVKPDDVNIPIVVLIDGNSASASEIVSGSLQDMDRAVVVGTTSYGKGLVQRTYDLKYGCKVKLTVAKYYTPSGRCVQRLEYYNNRSNKNPEEIPDSLITKFKTVNGREVIDGRGIEPDVNIPLSKLKKITQELLVSNMIFDYATRYNIENKSILNPKEYDLTDIEYNKFIKYVSDNGFEWKNQTIEFLNKINKELDDYDIPDSLKMNLKALKLKLVSNYSLKENNKKELLKHKEEIKEVLENEIVSRYYYQEGRVINSFKYDPAVKESIKILNDKARYNKILNN